MNVCMNVCMNVYPSHFNFVWAGQWVLHDVLHAAFGIACHMLPDESLENFISYLFWNMFSHIQAVSCYVYICSIQLGIRRIRNKMPRAAISCIVRSRLYIEQQPSTELEPLLIRPRCR